MSLVPLRRMVFLLRVGDSHRSIYLDGTPPPGTGRSIAASAYPAQLPLHRVGNAGPRRRLTRPAACLSIFSSKDEFEGIR
jgi:hypothetical protein